MHLDEIKKKSTNDLKQKVYDWLTRSSNDFLDRSAIADAEKLLYQEIFYRLEKLELNVRTLENLIDDKQDKE